MNNIKLCGTKHKVGNMNMAKQKRRPVATKQKGDATEKEKLENKKNFQGLERCTAQESPLLLTRTEFSWEEGWSCQPDAEEAGDEHTVLPCVRAQVRDMVSLS